MRAVARIRPGYELEAGITRRADFKPGVFGVRTTMAYVLDAIGVEKNPVVQPAQPWAAVVEPRHEKPSMLPVEPVFPPAKPPNYVEPFIVRTFHRANAVQRRTVFYIRPFANQRRV